MNNITMKFGRILILVILTAGPGSTMAQTHSGSEIQSLAIGAAMPDFELADFRGRQWAHSEFQEQKTLVVVFFGLECPLMKLYAPRLVEIQEQFATAGVQFIGINSNRQDSLTEINHFARVSKIEFPLLKDPGNRVADLFGATRTPEIFIFDQDRRLQYRGRIDDQYTYGRQKPKVEKEYLVDALKQLSSGKTPEPQETETHGCLIGRVFIRQKSDEINYAQHISRILQKRCVSCHRPGEIAPFALTEYDEVAGWAEMMREVVNESRMPPWHADPNHGEFKNDTSLTAEEKRQLNLWVENGAPLGDPADLPEPRQFVEGWQIGEPDVVIAMSKTPFRVPATGTVPYEYFEVDPGFKEDKWVSQAEIRIGNRAVVHHVIVAISDDGRFHGSVDSEWITACAPGSPPLMLPKGYAKLIPAGSKLLFQMHYTPNGIRANDISRVGFKFIDEKEVIKTVGTQEVLNDHFRIPAGAVNHPVKATHKFRKDSLVLSLFPHMHLRGKSFRYSVKYPGPDGKTEILLDVPNYDFNWQNGYLFKEPKFIPAGTVMTCVAHYDNSENNIANPNPNKAVRWGNQTWEEMMIGYFDMALADED